jgi:hypothetical protein
MQWTETFSPLTKMDPAASGAKDYGVALAAAEAQLSESVSVAHFKVVYS